MQVLGKVAIAFQMLSKATFSKAATNWCMEKFRLQTQRIWRCQLLLCLLTSSGRTHHSLAATWLWILSISEMLLPWSVDGLFIRCLNLSLLWLWRPFSLLWHTAVGWTSLFLWPQPSFLTRLNLGWTLRRLVNPEGTIGDCQTLLQEPCPLSMGCSGCSAGSAVALHFVCGLCLSYWN